MGINIRNSEGYMDTVPFQAISGIDREAKAASKPAFRPLVYICSSTATVCGNWTFAPTAWF